MLIDRYAYANRWSALHPAVKGVLAGFGLAASLVAPTPAIPLLVMTVMVGACVLGAGIPLAVCLRLLLVPAGFLLAGVAGLAVSIAGGDLLLGVVPGLNTPLFVTFAGLHQAGLVLARSLGAVASLYLLALTTPVTEIVGLLRRLRVPQLLLELLVLAYRQLFIFRQMAHEIAVAQQSRLGAATPVSRFRSLAVLATSLLLRTHRRSRQLHRALQARGYEDELRWLERELPLPVGQLLLATVIGAGVLIMALLARG